MVTTLVDVDAYMKEDIAELYHHRWRVELDIRSIKQTLKMDVLTCQTPEMVRKEIWTHLLGYNLVRKVMAQERSGPRQAATAVEFRRSGADPRRFPLAVVAAPRRRVVEVGRDHRGGYFLAAYEVDNRP